MANYSDDNDLESIFHGIAVAPGYALSKSDFADERTLANGWLNDKLAKRYVTPITGTISKSLVLAEANYAVYLILRSDPLTYDFTIFGPYKTDAKSIVNELNNMPVGVDGSERLNNILSTHTGVEPTFARSKFDRDGNRINPELPPRQMDAY